MTEQAATSAREDAMDKPETLPYEVTERFRGKAKVTMEWEVEADFETSEGGNVRCYGFFADPQAIIALCTLATAKLTMERISEVPT